MFCAWLFRSQNELGSAGAVASEMREGSPGRALTACQAGRHRVREAHDGVCLQTAAQPVHSWQPCHSPGTWVMRMRMECPDPHTAHRRSPNRLQNKQTGENTLNTAPHGATQKREWRSGGLRSLRAIAGSAGKAAINQHRSTPWTTTHLITMTPTMDRRQGAMQAQSSLCGQ